jgi:hypothetical protein
MKNFFLKVEMFDTLKIVCHKSDVSGKMKKFDLLGYDTAPGMLRSK